MKNTVAESPGRSQILRAYGRHLIAGVKVVKVPRGEGRITSTGRQ